MSKELIINAAPQGVEIALLEDRKLVELHSEKSDARFAVGDLYLGKVKKLIPGLNAAFVEVGFEKDLSNKSLACKASHFLIPGFCSCCRFSKNKWAAKVRVFSEFSNLAASASYQA